VGAVIGCDRPNASNANEPLYNNFTASQVESNGIHGSPAVTDSLRG